jgi:hypothetical protein
VAPADTVSIDRVIKSQRTALCFCCPLLVSRPLCVSQNRSKLTPLVDFLDIDRPFLLFSLLNTFIPFVSSPVDSTSNRSSFICSLVHNIALVSLFMQELELILRRQKFSALPNTYLRSIPFVTGQSPSEIMPYRNLTIFWTGLDFCLMPSGIVYISLAVWMLSLVQLTTH